MRVSPQDIIQQNQDSENSNNSFEQEIDIIANGESENKPKDEEKVRDEFAPEQDSFDKENGIDTPNDHHFPDESTIVINADHDDHDSDIEGEINN
mmetsp:Transcript_31983/g.28345  ORF Transcript_31983/g.28345 Transcript_31983/m.28345 type:complete len:95 (+) Transcript_31983:854-1138(+)